MTHTSPPTEPVALITGASRGIGAAAARCLSARGMAVILLARDGRAIADLAGQIQADGGRALAVRADVGSWSEMSAAVSAGVAAFGRIDVLLNNAGVITPVDDLATSVPDAWAAALQTNLLGVYHGLRAVLPLMRAQGSGVVINMSSGAAYRALQGWSHYCAAKAAVLALTRSADLENADAGIRVVGLSPGTVDTTMQQQIRASGVNPVSQLDPGAHRSPEQVAEAIAWLCSDAASDIRGIDFSLRDPAHLRRCGLSA